MLTGEAAPTVRGLKFAGLAITSELFLLSLLESELEFESGLKVRGCNKSGVVPVG
jgi:hypothetical protein